MTSAGGLVAAERFVGKDSILSGPAGGVVGFSRVAQAAGFDAGDRLRHGGHQHRRLPLRRPLRAGVRNRKGRRPGRGPDDGHRNRGGRRRLDLPLRRREAGRRPGKRRGRSGPGLLRPRRARWPSPTSISIWARSCPSIFPFRWTPAVAGAAGRTGRRDRAGDRHAAIRRQNCATASCAWPTPTWSRRFTRSRLPRGATRATTCWWPLAARPDSMPAPWPANWASARAVASRRRLLSAYGIGLADVTRHRRAPAFIGRTPRTPSRSSDGRLPNWPTEARREVVGRRDRGRTASRFARSLDLRYQGLDAALTIPDPDGGDLCRRLRGRAREAVRLSSIRRPAAGDRGGPGRSRAASIRAESPSPRSRRRATPCPRVRQPCSSMAAPRREPGLRPRASCSPATYCAARPSSTSRRRPRSSIPAGEGEVLARGELLLSTWRASASCCE